MTLDSGNPLALGAGLLMVTVLLGSCGLGTSRDTRIARAESFIGKSDYPSALIELRNVISRYPNDARALLLAAQASLQYGDPGRAEQYATAAASAGALPEQTASLIARSELAQSRFKDLLEKIDAGQLKLDQDERDLMRGQALLAMHRYPDAAKAFVAVQMRDQDSVRAQVGLARVHLAEGDVERAASELHGVLSRHPDDAEGWWVLGGLEGTRGHYDAMEQSLVKALGQASAQLTRPQRAAILAGLVEARLARGDVSGAAKAQADLNQAAPFSLATPYMSARVALARQDYTSAVATLTRLLNAAPDFSPGRFLLGTAMLAQGNLNQAELHLARVVNESPENTEARKLLAQVRMRLDRPAEAVQVLSPANEVADPQLQALLGMAQIRSGDRDRGISTLERSAREKPDDAGSQRALVAAYLATGQRQKAVEFLKQRQAKNPGDAQTYIGLAQISLRDGDRAGATGILEQGLNRSPDSRDLRLMLMRLYLLDRRTAQADALAARMLTQAPGQADLLSEIGQVDLESGRFDSALGRFRAAADLEPNNAEYWLNVGRAQLALNQPAAAGSFEQALKLRPNWLPALASLSLMELRSGQGSAAMARIRAARKTVPQEPAYAVLQGDLQMALKQYPEALKDYEQAQGTRPSAVLAIKQYLARRATGSPMQEQPLQQWLEAHPADIIVRTVLADAYREAGNLDHAISEYERIVKAGNARPVLLNNLAWAYFQSGDARAASTAREAYNGDANNPAIADTYGWILLESAQISEGLEILRKAAESAPNQPDIQYHYASALARAGRKQQALDRLKTLLDTGSSFPSRKSAERLKTELEARS